MTIRIKPVRAVLVLAVLLAAAVAGAVPAAAASTSFTSAASGRCLNVTGGADTPGTALEIRDCSGQASQSFEFNSAGELRALGGTRCVDAYGNQTAPGTAVIIWSCTGGANQQWRQNSDGSITGVQSGLCLDVNGAGTANGTAVILWTCHGQSNQRWSTGTQPPADGPVRHLRVRRHALRRRAQHGPRAVRLLQRQPVPGPARVRQHDQEHRRCRARAAPPTPRRRTRSARARPASSRSSTTSPGRGNDLWYQGSSAVPGSQPEQPGERDAGVADGRRQQGVLAVHQPRQQLLARRPPDRRARPAARPRACTW